MLLNRSKGLGVQDVTSSLRLDLLSCFHHYPIELSSHKSVKGDFIGELRALLSQPLPDKQLTTALSQLTTALDS